MAEHTVCRDCGASTEGWWLTRPLSYRNSSSAYKRCHPCYLRYCREGSYRRGVAAGPRVARCELPTGPHVNYVTAIEYVVCPCGVEVFRAFNAARCTERICTRCRFKDRSRRAKIARRTVRRGPRYSITDVIKRDGPLCHLCGVEIDLTLSGREQMGPTVDHVIPIASGGWDELVNVRLAHMICNTKRGVKPITTS